MNTIENLNERVEKAVHKFQLSEDQRRNENKSLSGILNDLEIKFEARTAELDDCHGRISELEASNVSLNALVCQLVEIVEKTADEAAADPVYRASAAASDIVERFVTAAAAPAVEVAGPPERTPENGPVAAAPAASLADGRFEDIEDEFLTAEDLLEKTEGASAFPKLVFDAVALARGENVTPAAAVDQPIDLPEPEAGQPVDAEASKSGGDLDIKEIMARLEMAAERAQLRADEDARRDQAASQEQKQARTA
jgi:hypothetical protein